MFYTSITCYTPGRGCTMVYQALFCNETFSADTRKLKLQIHY